MEIKHLFFLSAFVSGFMGMKLVDRTVELVHAQRGLAYSCGYLTALETKMQEPSSRDRACEVYRDDAAKMGFTP